MLGRYSEPMSNDYMREHCRYKIYQHYSGEYEKNSVIAFCSTLKDAKLICASLKMALPGDEYSFDYELCADFTQLKDADMNFDSVFDPMN